MEINVKNYIELLKSTYKKEQLLKPFLVETKKIDMISHKGCPVCNDEINQYPLPSESWMSTYHCVACNSLYFIHWSDRMGGVDVDVVNIYRDDE